MGWFVFICWEYCMEIDEFSKIGVDLFGSSWQIWMVRVLGVDGSSVW